ncbi:MAG: hypothetical protein AABX14_05860 [Candidatus Aenigmatarchaeota archaeon]
MRFPYLEYEGKYLPMVPIKLKGKDWVEFLAFVDSGAGYSVFKASAAKILGLEMENGKKEFVKIGDGSFIEVFTFKFPVSVGTHEFEAKIGFSRGLGIGFHIIGRTDIFNNFRICFDETERCVEFTPK